MPHDIYLYGQRTKSHFFLIREAENVSVNLYIKVDTSTIRICAGYESYRKSIPGPCTFFMIDRERSGGGRHTLLTS
jgi:hypothetical protein